MSSAVQKKGLYYACAATLHLTNLFSFMERDGDVFLSLELQQRETKCGLIGTDMRGERAQLLK